MPLMTIISLGLLTCTGALFGDMTTKSNHDGPDAAVKPPIAKKVPKEEILHGDRRVDNYFWLREKNNPEVPAYLEAENSYTDSVMSPTAGLQSKLYDEMLSHIKQTDVQVPYKDGEYFYYTRTEEGKQYPYYCRKKGSTEGKEEIILDQNELAKGEKFMSVSGF